MYLVILLLNDRFSPFLSASLPHSCALNSLVWLWILLSTEQQRSAWKTSAHSSGSESHCVAQKLWVQSEKCLDKRGEIIIMCGRTCHLATGVDAAKSFTVTPCCHPWASWGIALSLAPQQSPRWSRMLSSHTASCFPFPAETTTLEIDTSPDKKNLFLSPRVL